MGSDLNKNEKEARKKIQTVSSLRNESIRIYKSIDLKEPSKIILDKFLNSIKKDNTNSYIIEKYINFLISVKSNNLKAEFNLYSYFFQNGKLILFHFFEMLSNYKNDIQDKILFYQYFYDKIHYFEQINYKNNLPIQRQNNNLYFFKLYEHLIRSLYNAYKKEIKSNQLKKLIKSYSKDINTIKARLEKENLKSKSIKYYDKTLEELGNIYFCNFFNCYINYLFLFIQKIKNFIDYLNYDIDEFLCESINFNQSQIKKCKLIENFLFYIEKRPFTEDNNPLKDEEYYIFIDSALNREEKIKSYSTNNIEIIEKDKLNVFVKYNSYSIEFNDVIYSLGAFCDKIKQFNIFTFQEKKINFNVFNNYNIFRKNWDFSKNFIKDFFKSNLFKEFMLENDLYDLFNENNQQILDEILEEIYFYPFIAQDSVASTIAFNQTIYIQGESVFLDTFEHFIIVYTFQIISLLHELFHFYFNNMRYISQEKKNIILQCQQMVLHMQKQEMMNLENGLKKDFLERK